MIASPVQIGPLRSLLERFRRSAGVPAAVGEELSVELVPVFAALDEISVEVSELRARSEASAAARLQEAEKQAGIIIAEARRLAAAERDDELRSTLRRADSDVARMGDQARVEAEAARRMGDERLPKLVAEVLARVFEAEA